MIYNKKELKNRIADMGSNDLCYALIWTQDEFDSYFEGKQISKSDWESALNSIDSESEEQCIKEGIQIAIDDMINEEENA
jgi:hypothetical protein